MEYRELTPHPQLRPHVRCLWRLVSGAPDPQAERIVPDGCPELILNRAATFRRFASDGASHAQAEVLVVGQLTRPISIAPTGAVDLLGVRFEPGGLFALLGAPMHELTGADLGLSEVSTRLALRLRETHRLTDERELLRAVEHALLDQLAARRTPSGLAAAAVSRIESGQPTAAGVGRSLGLNRRGLQRLFRREVGLGAKLLIRIRRIQRVLARLDADSPQPGSRQTTWADLAAAYGFADQSHLIRDFRLLVGTTPVRYLLERGELAAQFVGGELSHSSNP